MVKPPKNMEPENVDLKKAGRTSAKAFEEDSFRNYMSRKIDMQRKQWGAGELPPDPRKLQLQQDKNEEKSGMLPTTSNLRTTPLATLGNELDENLKESKSNSMTGSQKRKLHHVSFAPSVRDNDNSGSMKQSRTKRSKGPINCILKKLERRHGRGFRRRRSCNRTEKQHLDDLTIDQTMAQALSHCAQTKETNLTFDSLHVSAVSGFHHDEHKMECNEKHDAPEGQEEESKDSVFAADGGAQAAKPLEDVEDSECEDSKEDHQQLDGSTLARSPKLLQARPDLFFFGVVIMVNGYTTPDTESLHRMVQQHGGFLEKYETSKITHIIAEHLSTAKAKIYKKMKKPIPVVKPSWIVDCVAAFRLLPHGDYLIDEVKDNNSGSMRAFLKKPDTARQVHSKCVSVISKPNERPQETNSDTPASLDRFKSVDVEEGHSTSHAPIELLQQHVDQETEVSSTRSATTAGFGRTDDKYINGMLRTTGTDPTFLNTFFSNSRLSFIGSYRQRVQESPEKTARGSGSLEDPAQTFVFHVDMDSFFASVVLRNFPQYKNKPVAISHFGKTRNDSHGHLQQQPKKDSTSECATCNYDARKYG
jgi:DNA repair protein REV1